ncbi:MAG TPA: hypothetical protein VF918_07730 [Anaerolineales bacterium]
MDSQESHKSQSMMECFYIYAFTNPTLTSISSHVLPSSLRPARCASLDATPLLEEKRDVGSQALISNIRDPFLVPIKIA